MRRTLSTVIVLLLVMVMTASGCGRPSKVPEPQAQPPSSPSGNSTPPINTPSAVAPLTGLPADAKTLNRRPLTVMIDNASTARPHSGLSKADLVYEMLVEGGITRIMAVFHSNEADVIGPVRSVRPAFLEKTMELGGVLVHCGGSEEALQSIPALGIRDIDEIAWTAPFWRDTKRQAPHNLFTSTGNLAKAVANRSDFAGSLSQPVFSFSEATPIGQNGKQLQLHYPAGYTVSYQYDAAKKVYQRSMDGELHLDNANKAVLAATNVIVEVVPVKVMDSEGRLQFSSVGKGDAYILSQGVVRKGQWVKDSRQSLTRFIDAAGKELTLSPGVTWVQQVAAASSVEIK